MKTNPCVKVNEYIHFLIYSSFWFISYSMALTAILSSGQNVHSETVVFNINISNSYS